MTDQQLVEQAKAGDDPAFEALVGRHHRAALRAALAALGSAQDADDVAQEAWITVHARLADFRGQAAFRTWLLTIVWNKALDRRRDVGRRLRRLVRLDEDWQAGGADGRSERLLHEAVAHAALHGGPSPEAAALDGELAETIRRLVRALPAKLRDPLLLAGSGEYTYEDIAALLDTPVGTAKWRVSEARRQVRTKLRRLGYE